MIPFAKGMRCYGVRSRKSSGRMHWLFDFWVMVGMVGESCLERGTGEQVGTNSYLCKQKDSFSGPGCELPGTYCEVSGQRSAMNVIYLFASD